MTTPRDAGEARRRIAREGWRGGRGLARQDPAFRARTALARRRPASTARELESFGAAVVELAAGLARIALRESGETPAVADAGLEECEGIAASKWWEK